MLGHLENEAIIETLRQKIERSPHFNPRKAFEILDQDGDGYISLLDVRKKCKKIDFCSLDSAWIEKEYL